MKQGTLITRIVMTILFAGVVLYLAIYAFQRLSDPVTFTMAYQDTLNDSVQSVGVVVRQEQVLASGTAIMDVLPEEGERVAAGEAVAILYQSTDALERMKQLESLTQEREQLGYALTSGGDLEDAAKLEQQIVQSILDLRTSAVSGDLSSLESETLALRSQVLRHAFAYSASGDSTAALSETISTLDAQIAQLRSQVATGTTPVYAPCSGLFSGQTDGLEESLTPAGLETISAAQVRELAARGTSPLDGAVGKLVTGDRWYLAAVVGDEVAQRLQPGDSVTVAFSRDFTGRSDMRVERVGQPQAEGHVLILSSNRDLREVTLLRGQSVEIIFRSYTGIRVPKQALRLEARPQASPAVDGQAPDQRLVVYALVGAQAESKPVDIVREGSDYYLVAPSADAGERVLRAGDEIIVTCPDLYDGKVVLK